MKSVVESKYQNVVFFSVGSLCQGVSLSRSIRAKLLSFSLLDRKITEGCSRASTGPRS